MAAEETETETEIGAGTETSLGDVGYSDICIEGSGTVDSNVASDNRACVTISNALGRRVGVGCKS